MLSINDENAFGKNAASGGSSGSRSRLQTGLLAAPQAVPALKAQGRVLPAGCSRTGKAAENSRLAGATLFRNAKQRRALEQL